MFIISKSYLIIIQGIIIILFLIINLKKSKEKYFLFSSKFNFSILLFGAIIIGIFFNSDHQLFCNPVKWTKLPLIFYSIYLIGNPILKKFTKEFINQLLLGLGLFISIYIILFGSGDYLFWSAINLIVIIPVYFLAKFLNKKFNTPIFDFLNLFGVTVLLPYIIIVWTLWQIGDKKRIYKIALAIMPIAILIVGFFLTFRMNKIINEINNSTNKYSTIKIITENKVDKYLTELILGAHWKYHTRICIYDGWRPPYHDPVLGFAQLFLYFNDHFNREIELQDRFDLYKKVFPSNKTTFDCKCAKHEIFEL